MNLEKLIADLAKARLRAEIIAMELECIAIAVHFGIIDHSEAAKYLAVINAFTPCMNDTVIIQ